MKTTNSGFIIMPLLQYFSITIIFLLLTLPFIGHIANLIKVGNRYFHHADFVNYIDYFIAILVIDAWCVIPFAKIRADGRPGRYGMIKIINIIIFITLNLIFIWGLPFWIRHHLPGSEWISHWYVQGWVGYVFLSNLIASVLTLLLLLPELLKLRFDFDGKMLTEMYAYSWPVLIANLSFIMNENLDKLMLG